MTLSDIFKKVIKAKPVSTSDSGKLDATDTKKIARDTILSFVASFLAWVLANIPNMNFGEKTALIVPILTVVVSTLYRLVKDNEKTVEQAEKQIEQIQKVEAKEEAKKAEEKESK